MSTKRFDFLPKIDSHRCTGCGWCVAACPLHLLSLELRGWRKSSVISDSDSCTGCKKCEAKCLFNAIAMVKTRGAQAEESCHEAGSRRDSTLGLLVGADLPQTSGVALTAPAFAYRSLANGRPPPQSIDPFDSGRQRPQ